MDIAIVNVAVSLRLNGNGSCSDARVALGSVGPTPLRARKAEAALVGELNEERIQGVAALAGAETSPIDDIRGGKAYRTHLVKVLMTRAIKEAMMRHRTSKP
jgi:CO/xanthine dehydrogenase FAD-binding subunit